MNWIKRNWFDTLVWIIAITPFVWCSARLLTAHAQEKPPVVRTSPSIPPVFFVQLPADFAMKNSIAWYVPTPGTIGTWSITPEEVMQNAQEKPQQERCQPGLRCDGDVCWHDDCLGDKMRVSIVGLTGETIGPWIEQHCVTVVREKQVIHHPADNPDDQLGGKYIAPPNDFQEIHPKPWDETLPEVTARLRCK